MPRFFFHVCDGEEYIDLQGTKLPNLESARMEAVRFAGELLAEKPKKFWSSGEWTLRVADEDDLTLFTLRFEATMPSADRVG